MTTKIRDPMQDGFQITAHLCPHRDRDLSLQVLLHKDTFLSITRHSDCHRAIYGFRDSSMQQLQKFAQFYFFFQSKHLVLTPRWFHGKSALFLSHDQNLTLRKTMWILSNKSSAQSIVKWYNLLSLLLYLHRGAEHYQANSSITEYALNSLHCLQITCRGLETSLAECHIEMKSRDSNEGFVSLQCHENLRGK